jgi:trehalose 6-phosphate phosphatase
MTIAMNLDEAFAMLSVSPRAAGVFSDFDGTLSPIVDRPEDARPVAGVDERLARLAELLAIVAVISGRALDDLRSRFAPEGVLLVGSYGRERSDRALEPPARDWEHIFDAATRAIGDRAGVVVERKGGAVALHYRHAPQRADEVDRIAASLAREFSLEVRRGRMVADLVQPGPGKAEALRDLVTECDLETFLFAGDDVSDGEAFEWARSSGRKCVLVGVRSDESPEIIEKSADIVVADPEEFVALLDRLAVRLRG